MVIDVICFELDHLLGDTATRQIARFSGRLTVLLLVAGSDHAPRRALDLLLHPNRTTIFPLENFANNIALKP